LILKGGILHTYKGSQLLALYSDRHQSGQANPSETPYVESIGDRLLRASKPSVDRVVTVDTTRNRPWTCGSLGLPWTRLVFRTAGRQSRVGSSDQITLLWALESGSDNFSALALGSCVGTHHVSGREWTPRSESGISRHHEWKSVHTFG
jgi:hypothetical protein